MAYLREDEDDNSNAVTPGQGMNNNAQDSTQMGAAVQAPSSPGGTASATANNAPTQPAPKGAKPASSGMGASFRDYLKANQGAATQRLGSAVEGRVTGAASGAQQGIQGSQNQFNKRLEQGSLANRQTAIEDARKASQQAQNLYTGDLAGDRAANVAALQGAQAEKAANDKYLSQLMGGPSVWSRDKLLESQDLNPEFKSYLQARQQASIDGGLWRRQQLESRYDSQLVPYKTAIRNLEEQINQTRNNKVLKRQLANAKERLRQKEDQLRPLRQSIFDESHNRVRTAWETLNPQLETLRSNQQTKLSGIQTQLQALQEREAMLNNPDLVTELDPSLQQRFADVINARYQGPQSLRQAGLYDTVLGQVRSANDMVNQARTSGGRQDLLRSMYGVDGQQYSRGLSGLDAALFNTNKGAVSSILNKAKDIGSLRGQFDKAQIGSEIAATNRAKEIENIAGLARQNFTTDQQAVQAATEAAIDQELAEGTELADLISQPFQQGQSQQKGNKSPTLSSLEAAILGVRGNEGLYNLGENLVKTKPLERERLVTKNQQARLAALAKMAELDQKKLLSTNNLYSDAEKAGTQTSADIIDRQGIRDTLAGAEQAFRDYAKGETISGYGKGKASKGNMFGTKTRTAKKTINANLAQFLDKTGAYDMDSQVQKEALGNPDILRNLVDRLSYNQGGQVAGQVQGTPGSSSGAGSVSADGTLQGAVTGAGAGASLGAGIGSLVPGVGTALGAATGALAGGTIGSIAGGGTFDPLQRDTEILNSLGLGDIGYGVQNFRDELGNMTKGLDITGGHISGAIGGINSKDLSNKAKRKALDAAKRDFSRNINSALEGQGYYNRAKVDNTDAQAKARSLALEALLRKMGV